MDYPFWGLETLGLGCVKLSVCHPPEGGGEEVSHGVAGVLEYNNIAWSLQNCKGQETTLYS